MCYIKQQRMKKAGSTLFQDHPVIEQEMKQFCSAVLLCSNEHNGAFPLTEQQHRRYICGLVNRFHNHLLQDFLVLLQLF